MYPNVKVKQEALINLASDIENLNDNNLIQLKLENTLRNYIGKVDCVILGCTHFPYLQKMFEDMFGCDVLNSMNLKLDKTTVGSGGVEYYTTGDANILDKQINILFNKNINSIKIKT